MPFSRHGAFFDHFPALPCQAKVEMSPNFQSRDVPPGGDISTFFRERGSKAITPGMIGGRFARVLNSLVDLLGIGNFRLFGLLVKNGVVQGFALVENGKLILRIQTNRYHRKAHGIRGTRGLDLVDGFAKLDGQILRECACFLPGQDLIEIVLVSEWAVGVIVTARLDCKTSVEIHYELWQVGIACLPSGDASQTQFFW